MTAGERPGPGRSTLEADLTLLPTKLARPRVPTLYVPRPRVHALLDLATRRPLTVVTAGPGWGKTLATAAWAPSGPAVGAVAWVSLDDGDDEPRPFWSYFVAAVRGAVAVPTSNPLAHIVPGPLDDVPFHRRLLTGLSRLDSPVVVV